MLKQGGNLKGIKRYYIFIFIFAILGGLILRDLTRSKFAVIKNSEAYAPVAMVDGELQEETDDKININTASVRLLTTLNGIGEHLAERIVEYRQMNGKFETIQDIMKVSGIGENTFEDIENDITVE